jgi:hypothetical protein
MPYFSYLVEPLLDLASGKGLKRGHGGEGLNEIWFTNASSSSCFTRIYSALVPLCKKKMAGLDWIEAGMDY